MCRLIQCSLIAGMELYCPALEELFCYEMYDALSASALYCATLFKLGRGSMGRGREKRMGEGSDILGYIFFDSM